MYDIEMIRRVLTNKAVIITHDPEYEDFKGIIKDCERFGVKVEVSGKEHTFKYSHLDAVRFPGDYEMTEIFRWWDHKKEQYRKEWKGEEPYNIRQVIYNYVKGYFTKRDQKKLYNIFDRFDMEDASGDKIFKTVIEFIEIEGRNGNIFS